MEKPADDLPLQDVEKTELDEFLDEVGEEEEELDDDEEEENDDDDSDDEDDDNDE